MSAPPELWPLVAASTVHAGRLRRRVLRSLRWVLLLAAVALVTATALVTAFVVRRQEGNARVRAGSSIPVPPRPPTPPTPPAAPRPDGAP